MTILLSITVLSVEEVSICQEQGIIVGIDVNFNASNFVETEEIFICHNYLITHLAVRGSVPIFWDQEGFGAPIKFSHPD